MSAWDCGYHDGFTYLDTHAEVTLSGYRELGESRSNMYVRCDRKAAYLEGWLRASDDYEEDWEEQITNFFRNFFAMKRLQKPM